ncbi:hypothetical protein JJV70_15310 [Streptomyces sp. JJ66]|uniref:hypothetical protein n=1 Tax=Streptomyces sp. JJ66 TaxID=2803843 RepID=UPI001C55E6D6|nr:hypothetical protein [Streptomyces sp. JJ66]MBW1603448.1 hypothetical protein [Streptomyces sp. JJ66]
MTISTAALAARHVIESAWRNGPSYDLATIAAFALEDAQLLQSPEVAAELVVLRARVAELERPAVLVQRAEVRESYRALAAQARGDGDAEGEADVLATLQAREAHWRWEDEQAGTVPGTERSRWEAIAAALNAVPAIGIDLDGTITDHAEWSVVWDRRTERWVVAAADEDATGGETGGAR